MRDSWFGKWLPVQSPLMRRMGGCELDIGSDALAPGADLRAALGVLMCY
jgi:hypothetical protein